MGQDSKNYVVEVTTSLDEPTAAAQLKKYEAAVIEVFKLKPERAKALLKRLPGVATKPLSQRDALMIAERFELIGLSAQTRSASTPDAEADDVKITSIRKIAPTENLGDEGNDSAEEANPNEVQSKPEEDRSWQVTPPERFKIDLSSLEKEGSSLKQAPAPETDIAARLRAIRRKAEEAERLRAAKTKMETSDPPQSVREPVAFQNSFSTRLLLLSLVPGLIAVIGTLILASVVLEPETGLLRLSLLSLIPLVLAVGGFFLVTRDLDSRLRYLSERAEAISDGDLSEPVRLHDQSELGRLAGSLERLRISMEEAMDRFRRRR